MHISFLRGFSPTWPSLTTHSSDDVNEGVKKFDSSLLLVGVRNGQVDPGASMRCVRRASHVASHELKDDDFVCAMIHVSVTGWFEVCGFV